MGSLFAVGTNNYRAHHTRSIVRPPVLYAWPNTASDLLTSSSSALACEGEMAPVTLPSRCFRTRLPVTRRHLELMPANVSQHTQAGTPGFWPWIIESSGTRENIAGGSAAGPPTSFVCLQKLDSSGGRGHITVHCPFRRRYSSVKPLTPMYHKAGLHTEIFAERAFEDRSSSLCWWRWFTLRW